MGGQNILFGFDDPSEKDKAVKSIQRQFARLGASVVSVDIPTTAKRKAGQTYRRSQPNRHRLSNRDAASGFVFGNRSKPRSVRYSPFKTEERLRHTASFGANG